MQVAHGVETNRVRKFKQGRYRNKDYKSCESLVEIPEGKHCIEAVR